MSWSKREVAMLREMGIAWPTTARSPSGPAAGTAEVPPKAIAPTAPVPTRGVIPEAAPRPAAAPSPALLAPADPHAASPAWPAVATADWDGLQAEVAACRRCGLCDTRRHTVFGVGGAPATWMIVGEAPGEQEDRQGEPFVGPAGQLLDRMLAALGLARGHRVFITNTVKCRPPQNRNPQPDELVACAPVLWRQIELVQPSVVVAMGRFAAQQLLASDLPIGRLRGQVHHLPGRPGVPVVVTYHPAYLLRNPADKGKAWFDLCLAFSAVS